MVDKEAAEMLTEEDVELIKEMDVTPMYISSQMIENIRTTQKQKLVITNNNETEIETSSNTEKEREEARQKTETKKSEKTGSKELEQEENSVQTEETNNDVENKKEEVKEKFDYGTKSSYFSNDRTVQIKDDRRRNEIGTKVEIMDDYGVNEGDKDVPEFLGYYNSRYKKMKKLLTKRNELRSATSIKNVKRREKGEEAAIIGLVKNKYSTSKGKYIVTLEDKTDTFKVLVNENAGKKIVMDEAIGVKGNLGDDIIFADSVIRADLPIPDGMNKTKTDIEAAFISDLHIGSKDTLEKRLFRFADWLKTKEAQNVGYLVIPGDAVEGVGTYPGQEEELKIKDIYKQYKRFEEWVERVPEDIQVIIGPGNHDITRLAEPQPALNKDVVPNIADLNNVHLVNNPQMVRLHGIRSKGIKTLMYHGYSFDTQIDAIKSLRENAYDEPYRVMVDLLKRRHLAPTYGSNLLSPEAEDHLVIDEVPDIFVAGHLHSHSNYSYKGVNVIASSTFQKQTDFQKRVGHEPDPGKVTFVNLKTRNTDVKQF